MTGRDVVTLIVSLLPHSRAKLGLLRVLRHEVAGDAHFGPNLVLRVRCLRFAAGAHVGSFNVFRDLEMVTLQAGSRVGQWNWLSASRPLVQAISLAGAGSFVLGRESALTSRHYVDCSGGVTVGERSTIAGVRSVLLTHQIDTQNIRQSILPIRVGNYCLISSSVSIAPGTTIGDRVLLAMGALARGDLQADGLYAGVPAVRKKDTQGEYFQRARGYIDVPD